MQDGILPIQVHAPGPASSTPVSRAGGKKATASSSSGPAGGSSLTLDADWISEHGRQVSCMLAGGEGGVGCAQVARDMPCTVRMH